MCQHMAEKAGKSLHPTTNTTSKNSDAMEVDVTCQQQSGKEVRNWKTYLAFMKGKCYGCGSMLRSSKLMSVELAIKL